MSRSETKEQYNERLRVYMQNRRNMRRSELIAYLGGKCKRCGTIENLEFDHIIPHCVNFRINGRSLDKPMDQLYAEVDRCQLLCHTCHKAKSDEESRQMVPWNKGQRLAGNNFGEHGVASTYNERGCRCPLCKKAKRLYRLSKIEYNERIIDG